MPKRRIKIKLGIDEVGRGPWAGPVVACAVVFHPKNKPSSKFLKQLTDSKKLTQKKRDKLYKELVLMSIGNKPQLFFGIGVVDNFIIDEINIRQANKEAMRRAILEADRKVQSSFSSNEDVIIQAFIDGRDNYKFEELEEPAVFIVGGDSKVREISAASIIAKVFRDKLMKQYATLYPQYGFETNVGYGTKKHQEQLKNPPDITGIHRVSYKPIKVVLEKNN